MHEITTGLLAPVLLEPKNRGITALLYNRYLLFFQLHSKIKTLKSRYKKGHRNSRSWLGSSHTKIYFTFIFSDDKKYTGCLPQTESNKAQPKILTRTKIYHEPRQISTSNIQHFILKISIFKEHLYQQIA